MVNFLLHDKMIRFNMLKKSIYIHIEIQVEYIG